MKKSYFLIAVFILIIATPAVMTLFSEISDKEYDISLVDRSGITYEKPDFMLETFQTGVFQENYETWFGNCFVPRGILVRTYNQLRFSAFGEANRIIGKNNNLFEESYIEDYYVLNEDRNYSEQNPENCNEMDTYLDALQSASEQLDKLGKHLIVYSSLSKCDYYSDDIPLKFRENAIKGGVRAIDYFKQAYYNNDYSFTYIDGDAVIEKANLTVPIFYETGIHWTRPAEQVISASILSRIISERNGTSKDMKLGDLQESSIPYDRDYDLWELVNIWDEKERTYYEYEEEQIIPKQYDNWNVLLQGSSFALGFRKTLLENSMCSSVKYVNYNLALVNECDNGVSLSEDLNNLNWQSLLDDADYIVMEVNPALINKYSDGFAEYLDAYLKSYIPGNVLAEKENLDYRSNEGTTGAIVSGVYEAEGGHAWTKGHVSIRLAGSRIREKGLYLEFAVPEYIACQDTVKIYVNGELKREVSMECGMKSVLIPAEEMDLDAEGIDIELYVPKIFVPKELKMNEDTRELALQLFYVGEQK